MSKISYITNIDEWKKEFVFSNETRIRFSETDMFGHMNNVSPFIYFEEARINFLKEVGLFDIFHDVTGVPVVADLQCDFHRQLYFDQSIRTYVKAAHIGHTYLDLHYMVLNEQNEIVLTGRGRIVHVDKKTGKPLALTDDMKDKLHTYTASE